MAADERCVVDQGTGEGGHRLAVRDIAQCDTDVAQQTCSAGSPHRALTKSETERLLIERQ